MDNHMYSFNNKTLKMLFVVSYFSHGKPQSRHLYLFFPQRGRVKIPSIVLFTINSEVYKVKILLLFPTLARLCLQQYEKTQMVLT